MKRDLLIVGTLAADLRAHSPSPWPSQASAGADITNVASVRLDPGGTAYLLAREAGALSALQPRVIASVGDDALGHFLTQQIARWCPEENQCISLIQGQMTCSVSITYFGDGTRFLVRPRLHAGKFLPVTDVAAHLDSIDPSTVWLAFISGYLLEGAELGTRDALHAVYEWSRHNQVQCVVDLVPHDFLGRVGGFERVESLLGGAPDGYIAEVSTIFPLFGREAPPRERVRDLMAEAASLLASRSKSFGVAQGAVSERVYAQTFATSDDRTCDIVEFPFSEMDRTGLGDRLALLALQSILPLSAC